MEIPIKPNDDPQFVELVSQVVSKLANDSSPEEIFVMKIDNWFDHKWLKFSGIGRVGFGSFGDYLFDRDTALDEFSQDQITFPPFSPNRVINQSYFLRGESGAYVFPTRARLVHQRKLAPSSEKLHKRVTDFADSAIFVWFSSNTKLNRRGSIMIYEVKRSEVHTWYASFSKAEEWRVLKTKGIMRGQVQSLMEPDVMQGHRRCCTNKEE
jgi:hypothetical protein